jgi:hypothetical protein
MVSKTLSFALVEKVAPDYDWSSELSPAIRLKKVCVDPIGTHVSSRCNRGV